jgi:hypothetical protein
MWLWKIFLPRICPNLSNKPGTATKIYKKQFPRGSWLGVKELALADFMIEIELESTSLPATFMVFKW